MKTTLRHIIFEFTLTMYEDEEIILDFLKYSKEKIVSKDISVYGFLVGDFNEFINKKVIFYN